MSSKPNQMDSASEEYPSESRKEPVLTIFDLNEEDVKMGECFHCGCKSVIWDCDYSFEDYGYEGEGIVQMCHCENCGAEIEYRISFNKEDE